MNRIAIVYNPVAGQGKAGERVHEVRARLDRAGVLYDLENTIGPGTAIEQTRILARSGKYSAIIAAGGDGTGNEVLNGLLTVPEEGTGPDTTHPKFGILPIGRGNDMAYAFGIPTDLDAAIELLSDGQSRWCDVGHVVGGLYPEGRYFGNGIGIGFDTIVGFEAAKLKRFHGFSAYLVGALRTLLFYYNAPAIEIRNGNAVREIQALQISVMNGRRMGGAFYMAPDAEVHDGLLDVCIAGTPKRLAMLGIIVQYLRGTQRNNRHITMERTQSFTVTPKEEAIAVHADGETISTDMSPLAIRVLPHRLQVHTACLGK